MISPKGSLIIPVTLQIPAELRLGAVEFRAKAEHHMTVFNYPIGRLVKKAIDDSPALGPALEALATGFDWSFAVTDERYHLVQEPPLQPLATVVAMITADLPGFFAKARALAGGHDELAAALLAPPPPHVTLYTTDPNGKLGIGLNSRVELDAARARAHAGERVGLCAFRLHPSVMTATREVASLTPDG